MIHSTAKCCWLCCLCCVAGVADLHAQKPPYDVFPPADPPYYRVRYEASTKQGELAFPVNYTVWIPKDVKTLRGVIVHQHGCGEGSCKSGLTGAYDLHWQALARKHDCALLSPSYEQPEKADCQLWCDPRNGSDAAFQKCLADLGAKSGHPELAEVPWALWGHSGGGHWAGGMVLLHPERVAAAWLRSGVPLLKQDPERTAVKAHTLPDAALKVPLMCNLGTKEGVTVKGDRFAGVWPANEAFFNEVRGRGGLVGVAIDPLTGHECGNQRYLAIPWLDACLSARLPKAAKDPLRAMPADRAWLAAATGGEAVPAAKYKGDPLKAAWLPSEAIAKAWMEYVKDTKVSDATPPPAPTNVRVQGNKLTWEAEADPESGLAGFVIERDGRFLANVPEQGKNPFGRAVFQNLQYSDTPTQPLVAMQFTDAQAEPGKKHTYRVIAVNTAGLKSKPSAESAPPADEPPPPKHTPVERLATARLAAAHEDAARYHKQRRAVPPLPGLTDYRCILHAHAEDSAHTGGMLPEMLADAKKAGVHCVLLTDHYRPPRDFIDGRWRGLKEGVLFIPGAEARGFLLYPEASILKRMDVQGADFINTVTAGDGMIFLSHTEERPDHPVAGLTGLEIFNRHWDAKRDKGSLAAIGASLTDPKLLAELQEAVRLYPDELLAAQCDYPRLYLDKWDEGTKARRLTGVAANDCHHNQVFVVKVVDEETVLVGTTVDADAQMRKVSAAARPGVKELVKGRKPGDVVARVDLDPYYRSFRNASTHVLAPKLEEAAIRAALRGGHAFVAHDWVCDATGFRFTAADGVGKQVAIMGDEVKLAEGLTLRAALPVSAYVRLLRHGKEVARSEGKAEFEFAVKEPGAYRLEAFLEVDGEHRPWLYANPIYVR